jgi:hypothetical protein
MFLALNRQGKSKEVRDERERERERESVCEGLTRWTQEILRLAGGTPEGLRKVLDRFEVGKTKKPESFVGRKLSDEGASLFLSSLFSLILTFPLSISLPFSRLCRVVRRVCRYYSYTWFSHRSASRYTVC